MYRIDDLQVAFNEFSAEVGFVLNVFGGWLRRGQSMQMGAVKSFAAHIGKRIDDQGGFSRNASLKAV